MLIPPVLLCEEFGRTFGNASTYKKIECYINSLVEPLLLTVGALLNFICLIMFAVLRMRSRNTVERLPLFPYLFALCLFDAIKMIFGIVILDVNNWPQTIARLNMSNKRIRALYSWTSIVKYYCVPILYIMNSAAIWTLTAITIERYRAVCTPFRVKICIFKGKEKGSWIIVLCLFMAAIIFNSPRWLEMDFSLINYNNESIIIVIPSSLRLSTNYQIVELLSYSICVYFGPMVGLVFLNGRMLCKLYGTPLTGRCRQRYQIIALSQRREKRTAWLLIAIIVLFLTCNTGGLYLRMRMALMPVLAHSDVARHQFLLLVRLSNFLFNLNSVSNPAIYFLFTRQFHDFWCSLKFFTVQQNNAWNLRRLGAGFAGIDGNSKCTRSRKCRRLGSAQPYSLTVKVTSGRKRSHSMSHAGDQAEILQRFDSIVTIYV